MGKAKKYGGMEAVMLVNIRMVSGLGKVNIQQLMGRYSKGNS